MAFSKNILPKESAYYKLHDASFNGSDLNLLSGGSAEVQVTPQLLPKLVAKMLVVAHASAFSSFYANNGPQVEISIITTSGNRIEYLIPVSETDSGVFNAEIILPEEEFYSFTFRLYSPVAVTFYNWELCTEEEADFTTIINGVTQEIPKLLYDYNTYAYAVGQKETTVGLISAFLHKPTDLQGHFTISFFATERCNVHVRIKDNGITELFSPQVYTVEKGYASVSIPHAYLKKLATAHSFSVSIQCSNGQISIPVRGVLYTIDGGYLASRLLDAGIDVEDITVKQLPTDNGPSAIYAVGYESNRFILKSREYSLLQRVNWVALKDFGEGNAAAVEFPGRWTLRANADRFTLETEENPVVLIVGTDNVLRAYIGEDYSVITEIDDNVTSVRACQGFSSMYYEDQNQGLVVVYLKEGNIYYSQYLYDEDSEEYKWSGKLPMYSNGDATFVSIHRLPDYRMGILITHATGTKWYITGRTYVAQGIKPELVNNRIEEIGIATVLDLDKADSINRIATMNVLPDDQETFDTFSTTFDYPLALLRGRKIESLKDATRVYVDDYLVTDAIDSLTLSDANTITVVLKEPVRAGKTVKIDYHFLYLAMIIYNGCFSAVHKEYTWVLPAPTFKSKEHVELSIKPSLNAVVKPLTTTRYSLEEDKIAAEIDAAINVTVSPVGKLYGNDTEQAAVNISGTVNATVTLVGTVPV